MEGGGGDREKSKVCNENQTFHFKLCSSYAHHDIIAHIANRLQTFHCKRFIANFANHMLIITSLHTYAPHDLHRNIVNCKPI